MLGMSTELEVSRCSERKKSSSPLGTLAEGTPHRPASAAWRQACGGSRRCGAKPNESEALYEAFASGVSRPRAAKPNIRWSSGRIGDGVGTKLCALTRGDLLVSARAVTVKKETTRW